MKKYFIAFMAVLFLCGCQQAPEKEAVTSKNNGVFQERVDQTQPFGEAHSSLQMHWVEEFSSTDGSVNFSVNVDQELSEDVTQVIEVKPHRLTEADIQRVASLLLEDAVFYDRQPSTSPRYSKSQYQEKMRRLSPYTNMEALTSLMGASDANTYMEFIQLYMETWTKAYETAPDNDPRHLCDWTLKKERMYNDSEVEIGDRPFEDDCDVLYANAQKNGIEYIFSVFSSDTKTYKLNRINLNLTEGIGLLPVDMAIYRSMLCRTEKPTEAQVNAVTAKAEDLLRRMELGQWDVIETEIETQQIGDSVEYTVHVRAAPVLNGVSVLYGQPTSFFQDDYKPTYLMTKAEFIFSANGDIIFFDMCSPMDIVETRNTNVQVLPLEELFEKARQHLSFSDADAYGFPARLRNRIEKSSEEHILCNVNISQANYCLGRVSVPESDDHYYYIPILALYGTAEYIGENTGTIHFYNSSGEADEDIPPLVCINAVDGSIIQQ